MNEFQRQKREKEFQLAILNAIGDKKKSSKVVAFINSAAFLWLLTLIVVTVGGSFFSERQQCFKEAQTQIEVYDKLEAELKYRQSQIRQKVADAKSIEELTKSLTQISHFSPEFAQFSTFFLTQQYRQLSQQLTPELRLIAARNEKIRADRDPKAQTMRIRFGAITMGHPPQNMTDTDLPALKEFVNPLIKRKLGNFTFDIPDLSMNPFGSITWAVFGPKLEADCGASVIMSRFWRGSYGTQNVVPSAAMYAFFVKTLGQWPDDSKQ